MFLNYEPGDFVINPKNISWGTGQIQSIIKNKVMDFSRTANADKLKPFMGPPFVNLPRVLIHCHVNGEPPWRQLIHCR